MFTMLAFGATFATYPYVCSFGTYKQIMRPYCTAEQTMSFVNMKVNTGLDVGTDFLSEFMICFRFGHVMRKLITTTQS